MTDLDELIAEARHEESIQDKLGDGFSEGSEERAFYYEHRDRYKRLADALVSVRAERDAALAAIERGRNVLELLRNYAEDSIGTTHGMLSASFVKAHVEIALSELDGAPEPEWEVQYGRRNRETGALHWLTGDPRDDWWHENQDRYEHVKRYTSPPLPVEGERER